MHEKRVTRDVDASAVADLFVHGPRATVAFVDGNAVDLVPVRTRCSGGRHFFGVALGTAPDLDAREVVLLLDDGAYWFELRGISVRGTASRAGGQDLLWYVVDPKRILAWDYGTLHEE